MPPLLAIDAVIFPFTPDTKAGVYADTPVLPWEREMNSVAWKHPNVYTGADCCHPRDWPAELSARGTEPFSQRSSSPSLADDAGSRGDREP